jgi:hypothetical protein
MENLSRFSPFLVNVLWQNIDSDIVQKTYEKSQIHLLVLYHFDRVFTGCDVWPSWTLPATVHKRKFGVTEAQYTHFLGENSWQVKILSESDLNMMFTDLRDPSRNTSSVQFKVICDPWLNTRSKWYSMVVAMATTTPNPTISSHM